MLLRMKDADQWALVPAAEKRPGQPRSFLCDAAYSLVPDERCRYCYFVAVGTNHNGHSLQEHILHT